jgi:Cu+-exporting ATPase
MADYSITDQLNLAIQGMTCASCSGRVERALRAVPGVAQAQVNLAAETAQITGAGLDAATLIAAVQKIGFDARDLEKVAPSAEAARHQQEARHDRIQLLIGAGLTTPLVLSMIAHLAGLPLGLPGWAALALATPVQFWVGARFYRASYKALRAGAATMDVLVALGTTAAYGMSLFLLIRAWIDGGQPALYLDSSSIVITLILFGKTLESRAKRQTGAALQALTALRPDRATQRLPDGRERDIAVESLMVGDLVIAKPGARIAVDGLVREGESSVDESMLTGESVPVPKGPGCPVTGGAINGDGLLLIETTAIGAETTLARIIRLVENAQAAKAPIQKLVDRVAAIFVPAVLVVAAITLLGWWFTNGQLEHAILSAVAVLVIACPCALGLATPTAIMAGTGVAATHGILIKDAETLERARLVDTVAFDKTGTLTEGQPTVLALDAAEGSDPATILRLAAALQRGSDHPLAKAVLARHGDNPIAVATKLQALPGRGIEGVVAQKSIALGSNRLLHDLNVNLSTIPSALTANAQTLEQQGRSIAWLIDRGDAPAHSTARVLGLIGFGDAIKQTAPAAIAALRARGLRVVLLTGDNQGSAAIAARALGITEVKAEILPAQKADAIAQFRAQGRIVAMVGDGVNDAPALAAADLGIAMATGSDIAMHSAGITLMRGDPALVAAALDISRRTYRKIQQGLFWAFFFNAIGIPLAALGQLSPVIAGAAMAFSSVTVVSNALLLRRWHP